LSVDLGNGTSISSWKCPSSEYSPMQGNPYLIDGLEVTDTEECARCRGNGKGYCDYNPIYSDDGLVSKLNFTCQPRSYWDGSYETKSSLGVILAVMDNSCIRKNKKMHDTLKMKTQ
nr:wall-associated kinase family protein [Tanacetum cinerariifolium]